MSTLSREYWLLFIIIFCCIGFPLTFISEGGTTVWVVRFALLVVALICVWRLRAHRMGAASRQASFLSALVLGIPAMVVGFFLPTDEPIAWVVCFGPLVLIVATYVLMSFDDTAKEEAPDLLTSVSSDYFEADGFSFWPVLRTGEGQGSWEIYYQNRYSHACRAQIDLRPMRPLFSFQRDGIVPARAMVTCNGGEFGVVRVPAAFVPGSEGKRCRIAVYGRSKFRNGRGDLVRSREGSWQVNGLPNPIVGIAQVGLALVGIVVFDRAASFEVEAPRGQAAPTSESGGHCTLWSLGDPVPNFSLHDVMMKRGDVIRADDKWD